MAKLAVGDLTSSRLADEALSECHDLPRKLSLLARIEKVLEFFGDAGLVLPLHGDSSTIKEYHPYDMVRSAVRDHIALNTYARTW
jgi:hypothetical protein